MIKKVKQLKMAMTILMAIMLMVSIMVPTAYAYEVMDETKPVTLAVEFTSGTKVSGMEFRAYKIAAWDEHYAFKFTSEFSGYGVAMPEDQDGYRALAETMAGYIARDGLSPAATAVTNENGRADFGQLEKGLYLITADRYQFPANKITYIVSPSLVALPNSTDNETWIYDVTISPKYREIPPLPETPGKTDINVIKVWTNEPDQTKRPNSIVAELICEGKVIDTVTLSSENNWRHTWKDLDGTLTYNVTEKEVPSGYTVSTVRDGNTFTIANDGGGTPPPTPPNTPRLPQTGQLWWPVPILAGAGCIFLIAGMVRRKMS